MQVVILYFPRSPKEVIWSGSTEVAIILFALSSRGIDRAGQYPTKCRLKANGNQHEPKHRCYGVQVFQPSRDN